MSSQPRPEPSQESTESATERLRLSVRTSMLSEFRDPGGLLGAFELSHDYISLGALRTALARLPGIRFDAVDTSLWAEQSSRFTYKERVFEITMPIADLRVAPAEAGVTYRETEDLLLLISGELLPKWKNRARSRFFRT